MGSVAAAFSFDLAARHRLRLRLAWTGMLLFLFSTLYYGLPDYLLDSEQRGGSPLNAAMRPSGSIGIRLGFLGLGIFLLLFLYPIRKRWPWLGRKGKTKHWLDFHVLLGVSAPIVITLHSSFKLRGLAGLAYWIMMAVALSGVVGRYLFSQIPRSMTTAELSFQDMEEQLTRFSAQMRSQSLLSEAEIAPLLRLPSREEVDALSLMGALWRILQLDLTPAISDGWRTATDIGWVVAFSERGIGRCDCGGASAVVAIDEDAVPQQASRIVSFVACCS